MTEKEIDKFILENDLESLKIVFDKGYNKLDELNKRIDKSFLLSIIAILAYITALNSTLESISIDPLEIKNIGFIIQIIPIVYSYFIFEMITITGHKTELFMLIKKISIHLFKHAVTKKEASNENTHSSFIRLFMPFSFSLDLAKLQEGKRTIFEALFGLIILFPFIFLGLVPIIIDILMIIEIGQNYYNDWIGIISFWCSIWILSFSAFYFLSRALRNTFANINTNQTEI